MQRAQLKAQKKAKKATPVAKKAVRKPVTAKKRTLTTSTKTKSIPAFAPLAPAPLSPISSFTSLLRSPLQLKANPIGAVNTTARRGIKCNAEELRAGSLIKWGDDGKLFKVMAVEKKMMGRRPTSLSVDLKDILGGKTFPTRMMPADTVERVDLDLKYLLFLYADGEIGHMMNPDTFDQIEFPSEMLGKVANWLPPDIKLACQFYNGELFSINPPDSVIWEVDRDDTDINSRTPIMNYKNVFLTNGAKVAVPEFIKPGEKVKIKLETFEFMLRAAPNEQ